MTEWDDMLAEELRPYRKLLTDQGVREAQNLVRDLEGDPQAEAQRVYGYHLSLAGAQLRGRAGGRRGSRSPGSRRLPRLAEALAARDPSVPSRELLGAVFHRLITLEKGPELHRSYARRSNAIFEALAAEQPDKPYPNAPMVALNYHNIGDEYYREHRFGEAVAAFDAGIRVCEEQIRLGDRSESIQLDLAQNLLYRSRAVRDAGHPDEAVAAGNRSVAVYRARSSTEIPATTRVPSGYAPWPMRRSAPRIGS